VYKEALPKYEEMRKSREISVDARRVGNGATPIYSYPKQQKELVKIRTDYSC